MPLQQRVIEPVNISRSTLPLPPGDIKPLIKSLAAATGQGLAANAAAAANISIINELECVSNGSLANLIRQLSSLSRQAEELLTGVFDDASKLLKRTIGLQQRMDSLTVKIEALDHTTDAPIILRDPTSQRESFSSDMSFDQQVLSKDKMPSSISELYEACDKPPPLNKLDPYRDDGKDGLKFYTDPTYFFELWKKDMIKQQGNTASESRKAAAQVVSANNNIDTIRRENRQKHQIAQPIYGVMQSMQQQPVYHHQQPNQNHIQTHEQHYQQTQHYQQQPIYQTQRMVTHPSQQSQYTGGDQPNKYDQNSSVSDIQSRISSLSVSSATASMSTQATTMMRPMVQSTPQANSDLNHHNVQESPPPPPPPPALSPLPPPALSPPPPPKSPPPPPAPPAPPSISQPPTVLQPPTAAQLQQKQRELKKTVPVQRDPRSDLLAAIKQGITLRKVEDRKKQVEAENQNMGNDVASILARRVAMQASDSESEQGSDGDEQEWEDANNR